MNETWAICLCREGWFLSLDPCGECRVAPDPIAPPAPGEVDAFGQPVCRETLADGIMRGDRHFVRAAMVASWV